MLSRKSKNHFSLMWENSGSEWNETEICFVGDGDGQVYGFISLPSTNVFIRKYVFLVVTAQ